MSPTSAFQPTAGTTRTVHTSTPTIIWSPKTPMQTTKTTNLLSSNTNRPLTTPKDRNLEAKTDIPIPITSTISVATCRLGRFHILSLIAEIFSHNLNSSYQMVLSYDFPYWLIVTIVNFLFLGCFVTKKNSYSYSFSAGSLY